MSPFQVEMVFLSHTQISSATCRTSSASQHAHVPLPRLPSSPLQVAAGTAVPKSQHAVSGTDMEVRADQYHASLEALDGLSQHCPTSPNPLSPELSWAHLANEAEVVARQHQAALGALDALRQQFQPQP